MQRSCSLATLLFALIGKSMAQAPSAISAPESTAAALPLSYVGSNTRIGLSIDRNGEIQGEALGVLAADGASAFLAQGWLGNAGAGGIQADYHWVWNGDSQPNTLPHPDEPIVTKFFVALDRNAFDDRKASLGFGWERDSYGLDVYYSRAVTDERLISSDLDSRTETITGIDNGRVFLQDVTIDTLTQRFEHPYDQGIGVRVARFLEQPLLRLRGGLDYERGDVLLQGDTADQLTFTIGLEKYFAGSPHSIAVDVEHLRKEGPFDVPTFGGKRNDTRATLAWRYEFGRPFRPSKTFRERQVTRTVQSEPALEPQIHRTELQLSSEALFEFDRAEVTPAARTALHELVLQIKNRHVGDIEIVGHTCDLGSEAYNQRLSERRAFAVRDWLIAEGFVATSIKASGQGEREPRHPNDSEENRSRNRRIALVFSVTEEQVVTKDAPPPAATTETVREPVATPAAWIERALLTPSVHKRTVDIYRVERVTRTRTEGERVFLGNTPQPTDDTGTTAVDTSITIAVLANDVDADGDTLQLSSVSAAQNGTVVANADGTVTYTPNAGFTGTDRFAYTVADPSGRSSAALVTITVTAAPDDGPNEAPTATDDQATLPETGTVIIDVLSNDSDPEDGTLRVVISRAPANGTAQVNDDGRITYTRTGASLADTFEYTVTDEGGLSDTATVRVTPAPPVNLGPIATDDAATIEGSGVIDVLANDTDPEGGPLTVVDVRPPLHGAAALNGDGTITYTPTPGFTGADTFQYTIRDIAGSTGSARVNVTVPNHPPVANDDEVDAVGLPSVIVRMLDNDSDQDSGTATLTVTITRFPIFGTLTDNGNGTFTYTRPNVPVSADNFEYRITDPAGASDTALVTLFLQEVS